MKKQQFRSVFVLVVSLTVFPHGGGKLLVAQPPSSRQHTTLQKGDLKLVPANRTLRISSSVSVEEGGNDRVIQVNGIPNHKVGAFPNRRNPHSIAQHLATYRVPLRPKQASQPMLVRLNFSFWNRCQWRAV